MSTTWKITMGIVDSADVRWSDLKENRGMKTKKYLLGDGNGEVVARGVDPELEMNKVIFQGVIEKLPPAQPEDDWIPVDKDMPDEYDSIFTRFHGTDKWRDGMWLKSSAKVLVTVEFEDGTRLTETAKTIDGKWATENRIRKRKVIAWQKMPKEYKGK